MLNSIGASWTAGPVPQHKCTHCTKCRRTKRPWSNILSCASNQVFTQHNHSHCLNTDNKSATDEESH
ncbi:hypothetical protein cgR_5041 [Corynebacterium glutamicum R]|uniref:Uncharacterized protein n=1 Tax=Corynebacterium glutamicum (strain R) TaxID=340322 RepID=A0AB72VCP9_CORGB|nr:hypothetical protein cgR_5041 [Corynebacterium glutamicum R]